MIKVFQFYRWLVAPSMETLREMNAPNCSIFIPVQQLPETPDLPSSATELLLGLQPRLRLPTLQGGRRTLCKAALGLLHPRAISALQPVAVTIRELSEPPPFAHRGRSASPLLQIDLSVPDDRALESSLRFRRRLLTMENALGGRDLSLERFVDRIHRYIIINFMYYY